MLENQLSPGSLMLESQSVITGQSDVGESVITGQSDVGESVRYHQVV